MLVFIILYGVIALPSPPVVRSVLLCACLGFGVLQRRSTDPLQLLALSILAMLVFHPLDLFNAGFQLSFGTVLGLMLFAEPVLKLWPGPDFDEKLARAMQKPGRFSIMTHKLGQMTRATVTAGLVAWVVSMPLIALHFEQLNPWALLASIVLAPFVFVALIGGFAKVILTMLWPSLAGVWAGMAIRPVAGMRHVVDWLATFPGADIPLPAPPVWMVLLFYALLLLNLVPWKSRVTRWAVGLAAVAGCLTLAILPLRGGLAVVRARSGEMKVTLLSIGAGQCAVVEPPGADAVVIDAGSMAQTDLLHKTLGPFLRHEGRRDIREVFISHANYDHFSAVAEISQAYDVHDIFVAPQFRRQSSGNAPAEVLLQTLDQLDRPPKEVSIGRSFNLGGGATMEVLWPPADSTFDANNTSLVMRLTFAGRSVLFTGDIQGAAERELLAQPDKIKSDVLIGPHHGSRESTTLTFINAVAPAEILCSNDRSLSVKQKEFDREMQGRVVYRTHTSGAVTIHISKEGQVSIEPYLQEGRKR
jgi:competence protein ComEC